MGLRLDSMWFGKEAMGMRVGRKKKLAAVKAHGMEKPIDLV